MTSDSPVFGLVLTGGASRRMGRDKAALPLADSTFLERTVDLLNESLRRVYVSIAREQLGNELRNQYPVIVDGSAAGGPAAGLLAAHESDPEAAWLVVACDMPGLTRMHIDALLEEREASGDATAWLAADGSGIEPLCAIYEPANLADFMAHVRQGGSASPRDWLARKKVKLLAAGSENDLRSVNTPEDFESMVAGHDSEIRHTEN